MRFGISTVEPPGPNALNSLCDQVRHAADEGFSSVWVNNVFGVDALTAITVIGSRVPGIELGTAVVPVYSRHPITLAQQALTVVNAIGPRLTLGIGLSHKIIVEEAYGYEYTRPLAYMREYLSVLLPLLEGQPVSYRGRMLRGRGTLPKPAHGPVPVMLAALGPGMLGLAAEETGGTVLWMTGPRTVRSHVMPSLRASLPAGEPSPRVVCVLPVCVTDDPEAARARAATAFAAYGPVPSYRAMLEREGAADPADVAIIGNEDSVTAQIIDLRDAGVTDFVMTDFTDGDESKRTRALMTFLFTQLQDPAEA